MIPIYCSKSWFVLGKRYSDDATTNGYYSSVASLCDTVSWTTFTSMLFGAHTKFRKSIRLVFEDAEIDTNTAKF